MRLEAKTTKKIEKLLRRGKINNAEELKEYPDLFSNVVKGMYFDLLDLMLKIMKKHVVTNESSFVLHLGDEDEKPIHFSDLEHLWDFIIREATFEQKVKILDEMDDITSEMYQRKSLNCLYIANIITDSNE